MSEKLAPGALLDGFHVGEYLHAGAMGDIYRVAHPDHALPLVLKVPSFQHGLAAENLLGYETECMILPALQGRFVPRFVAAGDIAALPYIVLEYIPGRNLEERRAEGAFEVEEIAALGAAIADALHSIHQQGVIHLDLKPGNVLLREGGGVALVDFGLAHHQRFPDLLAEEQRFLAGSAPYVSPEQVDGCRSDPRSDLFALGVILYELATGELPFGAPESQSGLRDRLWLDPAPPRALEANVPPWLQEVILRCLEINADDRYQTASHVAFDLRHPEQIVLTARSSKLERAGVLGQIRRWWRNRRRPDGSARSRREPAPQSTPVLLVAVHTENPNEARHEALHQATRQALATSHEFRLICLTVLRHHDELAARTTGEAQTQHLDHLVHLRHWVEPLHLPPERLSLHVVDSLSPAAAIVEFARANHVDQIIIGAPDEGQGAGTWWRSAASSIAANAPCSVLLVRTPAHRQAASLEALTFGEDDLP